MNHRNKPTRPPGRPAAVPCQVIECFATDDLYPSPGRSVELIPVGPPPLVIDLRAEDVLIPPKPDGPAPADASTPAD